MRIAVFSDIHGNLEALKAVIGDIKKSNFDKVYFLGDAISKGPNPRECLDLIMENNINMVLGNHELYYLRGYEIDKRISEEEKLHQKWTWSQLNDKHREYLNKCPLEISEVFDGIRVCFKHFFMEDINLDYPFYSVDILNTNEVFDVISSCEGDLIFVGHEHGLFEIDHNNKNVCIVGSSGCTFNSKTHYIIVSFDAGKYSIEKREINYDRKTFEKVFLDSDYPEKDLISEVFFGL